jgi:SAM-dependent methyltransferase
MKRFYDKNNNRLVYIGRHANIEYWDNHWDKNNIDKMYPKRISRFDYVINTTKKYLKAGSLVLEGGCGIGQQVFKLQNENYKTIGVDYAKRTIEILKKAKPELDIRLGDVRNLDFKDNFFDGYWSFGVIEHFFSGYYEILNEMHRVIKPGGYLFLTFPHMSILRKLKVQKNKYTLWQNNEKELKTFYQFALDEKIVINDFEKLDFKLINTNHLDGLKGLKDEMVFMKKTLQKIYNSRNFFGLAVSKIISLFFGRFSSHSILLILQKQ